MSKSAHPDLINSLTSMSQFGFTKLQASAYIALLQMGEETGSSIAAGSGINRSKIYDILGQLEELGAINKVSREGKIRYVALPPDVVLPKILKQFTEELGKGQRALESISDLTEEIDPIYFTHTKINLKDLNTNDFDYMISSTERSRIELVDRLPKDNRPTSNVNILNLNLEDVTRGYIFLVKDDLTLLFGTPVGQSVEATRITSSEISKFILAIIRSSWTDDLPPSVVDEMARGERRVLLQGKSMFMRYELVHGKEFAHPRPITFVCTDTHLSFFYLGEEDPKIPLFTISEVNIESNGLLKVVTAGQKGPLGTLIMKTVDNPVFLSNILKTLSPNIS
ncbi:MAG: TrmB family transcriptional regulator [Candidatus Kariarchaeaceae archaeon]|jgi:predicted transcriptional regulator